MVGSSIVIFGNGEARNERLVSPSVNRFSARKRQLGCRTPQNYAKKLCQVAIFKEQ